MTAFTARQLASQVKPAAQLVPREDGAGRGGDNCTLLKSQPGLAGTGEVAIPGASHSMIGWSGTKDPNFSGLP